MTFSPMRALAFAIIGLPVGFVLSALALVATGQAIEAQTIASYALAVALTSGVVAGLWKDKE